MIGAPNGVPPMKQIRYSAITRPRMVGSTPSCTDAFAAVVNVSIARPVGTSSTAVESKLGIEPGRDLEHARTRSRRRSGTAASAAASRRVASTAPTHAPTASAVDSRP